MHLPFRSTLSSSLVAIALSVVVAGCTDAPTATAVDGIQMAKGGGKGPTVDATDPTGAPQETTLDVRVLGSGFEDGFWVKLLLNGVDKGKVRTNSVKFVGRRELVANITIDLDADIALYDVHVIGPGGKKGIGTELFAVTQKGSGGGGSSKSIELVGLEVQVLHDGVIRGMTDVAVVDLAIAAAAIVQDDEFLCELGTLPQQCTQQEQETFFGCPDITQPCAKVLFTFRGGVDNDNIGFKASHSIQGCAENEIITGGCVYDLSLGNRWRAAGWSQQYQPTLLIGEVTGTEALADNGDGTRTLTIYWQGQRGQRRLSDSRVVWSRYPDLDPPEGPDYFVFRAYSGNRTFQSCPTIPTPCWTEYNGDPGTQAFVTLDDIQLVSQRRGKKATGVAFEIQAFRTLQGDPIDYLDPGVVAANLESWASVMLVYAGEKQMLALQSVGTNPDDPDKPEIYRSGFRFMFPETGCYEFHLLEVFIQDVDHLEYVWYSGNDVNAIKVFRVDHVEGGETTWMLGETCDP